MTDDAQDEMVAELERRNGELLEALSALRIEIARLVAENGALRKRLETRPETLPGSFAGSTIKAW